MKFSINDSVMYLSFIIDILKFSYFCLSSLLTLLPSDKTCPTSWHLLKYLKSEIIESDNEKSVLNHLAAAVLSMELRYEADKHTLLVVDAKSIIESAYEQIKDWKKLANQNVRDVYQKDFEINFKKMIENAKNLVDLLQNDVAADAQSNQNKIESIIERRT